MSIQFTAKRQQSVVADAKTTELGLERVHGEAAKLAREQLADAVQSLSGARPVIETAISKVAEARAAHATSTRQLRYSVDALVAFANAVGDQILIEMSQQRDRRNDLTFAELVEDHMKTVKVPVLLAVSSHFTTVLARARATSAAIVKAAEGVARADVAWSTEYFRLVGLINLGISMQQSAGLGVARKTSARSSAKKAGGTSSPASPVAPESPTPTAVVATVSEPAQS